MFAISAGSVLTRGSGASTTGIEIGEEETVIEHMA